MSDDARYIYM